MRIRGMLTVLTLAAAVAALPAAVWAATADDAPPLGSLVSERYDGTNSPWRTAQAGCAENFCVNQLSDCRDACEESMTAGAQRDLCEGLCDEVASRCATCCSNGGTSPDCWQ